MGRSREAWKNGSCTCQALPRRNWFCLDTWLMPSCWWRSSSRSYWCVSVGLQHTKALPQHHICSSAGSVATLWTAVFPCLSRDLQKIWRVERKTLESKTIEAGNYARISIARPFHEHFLWRLPKLKKQVNQEHLPSLEEWSLSLIIYC